MDCDPKSLAAAASCFQSCVSTGEVGAIKLYLLRHIAGLDSTTPQELANLARCFDSCIPPGMQRAVENYLLCQIVNRSSPCPMCLILVQGEGSISWTAFAGATRYLIEESSDGETAWSSDGFFVIGDSPLIFPGGAGVYYRITPYNGATPLAGPSCGLFTV